MFGFHSVTSNHRVIGAFPSEAARARDVATRARASDVDDASDANDAYDANDA